MKKPVFFAIVLYGMALGRALSCENPTYVPVTTSCGLSALASGCTANEIAQSALEWDDVLCGGDEQLPPG